MKILQLHTHMTFSNQDLSHAYSIPEALELTMAENYNQKVIWESLPLP